MSGIHKQRQWMQALRLTLLSKLCTPQVIFFIWNQIIKIWLYSSLRNNTMSYKKRKVVATPYYFMFVPKVTKFTCGFNKYTTRTSVILCD